MPIYSWMRSPSGNPVGPTAIFSSRECLLMQRPLDEENMIGNLPGPLAAITGKKHPGGSSLHGVVDTQIHMGRDHGFTPPSISVEKKPERSTLL